MKKQDLPTLITAELLDRLYGFCYARTSDHSEADALCSDICYAILRTARKDADSDISAPNAFLWRIAHNVYADFSENRAKTKETASLYDPDVIPEDIPDDDGAEQDALLLADIYREIAFLGYAYRTVTVAFYLDGMSVAEIAKREHIAENTVRQRLFAAREILRKETTMMNETKHTIHTDETTALHNIMWAQWGNGNPLTGQAFSVCQRQLSRHVVWLCRKQARTAREISDMLHIPMTYAEEELETQVHGENGYGMLRRTESGKYISNVLILDKAETAELQGGYLDRIPEICDIICDHAEKTMEVYLSHPYLNRVVDKNLVLWRQVKKYDQAVRHTVKEALERSFADVTPLRRPYTNYGFELDPTVRNWGGGCDGVPMDELCGYKKVHLTNLYNSTLDAHFHCDGTMLETNLPITTDPAMLLAIRAVEGISASSLTEEEKEFAAHAIERDLIFREGDMLYTKFLVTDYTAYMTDDNRDNVSLIDRLAPAAAEIAEVLSGKLRRMLPAHLLTEYPYANDIAGVAVCDSIIETLIARGMLVPPKKNRRGAEGLWMAVKK